MAYKNKKYESVSHKCKNCGNNFFYINEYIIDCNTNKYVCDKFIDIECALCGEKVLYDTLEDFEITVKNR